MAAYKVQVIDSQGAFVVGATLNCPDDASAVRKFDSLPLPPGTAQLLLGARVVAVRPAGSPSRAAS